ncbi:MAG TPA: two-component regulator propeller domain-containing protein [Saprospiraceae bacterium]|nr:two-component regulator propeller domain-containing protein [Saprospiraceae bacterium]HPI07038.1 two-component regulator propeller domain-containing protein [Saprospiraceae bacterium]
MRRRIFIFLFFLIKSGGFCTAQQPFYINYQTKEGIFSNYIYFVYQDSKGYIWVGSDVGASRFDGSSFTNFNTGHGMSDNEVFSMMEDRKGRLWFATLNGKPCFYQDGVIYNEKNLPLLRQCETGGLVQRILQRQDGSIALCSAGKTVTIDPDAGRCETLIHPNMLDVWENAAGRLMCFGTKGVQEVGNSSFYAPPDAVALRKPVRVLPIGDTILVSSVDRVMVYESRSQRLIRSISLPEEDNEIIYMQYRNGEVWLGTRNGLQTFEYPSFRPVQQYLPGRSVTSALQDREGGWWFSTLEEGLFYVPAPTILHFTKREGLLYNRVICLSRDVSDRLWIGSEGSTFAIFDGKTIRARQILQEAVKNITILNIRQMPDGSTLVVGKAGTLIIRGNSEQFLFQRASDVNVDARGDCWAGQAGLFRIKKDQLPYKLFPLDRLNRPDGFQLYARAPAQRLSELRVEKVEFDSESRVWLAASTGLYYTPDTAHFQRILPYLTRDILFDPVRNVLWALTESNGLFAVRNGMVVDSTQIANSRGNVICRDLCRDASGNLWIGSSGGLFRVSGDPGQLQLTSYWGVYGLQSEKVNAVEVIAGKIFIGKDDGLLMIPENMLSQSMPAPPVWIRSVRVDRKAITWSEYDKNEIAYGSGPLIVEFESLSYREARNIRYRYRLAGLDDNWRETTLKTVEFAALRPGSYALEIYSVNGSGNACAQPAVLHFHVMPPFWLRRWFLLLALAALAAATVGYIRWREKRLHRTYEVKRRLMESSRENAELQQKNTELQMLALRLQMNPHFIFNALNTIKGYYGQEKFVEANMFIGRFARLLRINLDYSDAPIPLEYEIELLKIYVQLSQTRYPGKIALDLFVDPDLHPMEIVIPSMLIQPFVENAVIHGLVPKPGGGLIFIGFYPHETEIRVCIRDNGIGRAAAAQLRLREMHKPLATQITGERLRLLRVEQAAPAVTIRDLFDHSGAPAGTEVTLFIPFKNNHSHD